MSQLTDRMRARLEARLASLQDRLAEMNEILREPEDDDLEEAAADMDEDEVLSSLASAGRTEMLLIRDALRRINEGTYGKCVSCGQPIPERRLQALPEAEKCLKCAADSSRR